MASKRDENVELHELHELHRLQGRLRGQRYRLHHLLPASARDPDPPHDHEHSDRAEKPRKEKKGKEEEYIMARADMFLALSADGFDIEVGAKRGSADARCPGSIEVLGVKNEIRQIGSEDGGRPRSVETVEHGEMRILKYIDRLSPKLFQFCSMGRFIGEARLLIYSAHGGYTWSSSQVQLPNPCMEYRMSYVHISSIELEASEEDITMEWIGLKYGQMKMTWDESGIDALDDHTQGKVVESWSHVMEMPATAGIPGGTTQGSQPSYTVSNRPHWA